MKPFGFKYLPVRLIGYLRMFVGLGVSNTLVEHQAVQLYQALDPQMGVKNRSRTSPTWFSTAVFILP
jgi:hypothetical protein